MKALAIVLNLVLVVVLIYLIFDNGLPKAKDWGFVLLFLSPPVSSLIALLKTSGADGLIATFIERKKLEEKKKIQDLKHSTQSH